MRLWAVLALFFVASATMAQTPEDRATQLLNTLTLEQKVAQLFLVYHSAGEFMAEHGFGGSLVMESMVRNESALKASIIKANQLGDVPLLVAMDQEGGEINRLRPLTGFNEVASAAQMGTWSPDSVRSYLQPVAVRLNELGINCNLAPVLDPAQNVDFRPTLMAQRQRSFGSTSATIVPPAKAFMAGCADHNIFCILKHFPGYVVEENSDHEVAESVANKAALKRYVYPFAASMDDAGGVMMSSILFSMVSDRPAVFDTSLVALARCGFQDRLVMTDDLWGTALRSWVSGGDVARTTYPDKHLRRLALLAFDAGNDMLMITYPAKAVLMAKILVTEIEGNFDREKSLDDSVYRILLLKAKLGLL